MRVLLQAISRRIFGGGETRPVPRESPRTHVRNGDSYCPRYTSVNHHLGLDRDGIPIKETRREFAGYDVQPGFIPWASVKATFPTKESLAADNLAY